ncbi:MAG: serine/threonine protein kinase, partial [Planctomycetes bacterium]|nr:serine/threonine protein kinase [Planctomycetota bacterium]
MTGAGESSLGRLEAALHACMAHRMAPQVSDEEFLAQHEELRDLLEPMLFGDAEAPDPGLRAEQPRHLGDFRIVRELGRGGMGVVYEAEQTSLGRRVALKVLHAASAALAPAQIERFRREAAAAAKLRHPGIVPIHAVGEAEGVHFIAMELIEGQRLSEHFAGRGEPRQVAGLIALVADALGHAHDHGIVHRDIKPQNILVAADGSPRVVDFGLAKDLQREGLSVEGTLAGTPYYMSPEQALPGHGPIDGQSDVFSLGVVLYEALTGRRPFEAETSQQVLALVTGAEPPRPRLLDPGLPRDLETICLTAIEKDRARRYPSAHAMAADLRAFCRGEPIAARPLGPAGRTMRLVRRHKLATVLIALAALALVGTPLGILAYQSAVRRGLVRAILAVDQVVALLERTRMSTVPGKQDLYREHLLKATRAYQRLQTFAPKEPLLRDRLARALDRLATSYDAIRRFDLSGPAFDQAVAMSAKLAAELPQRVEYAFNHASHVHNRALSYRRQDDVQRARAGFRDAAALWEPLTGCAEAKVREAATLMLARVCCNEAMLLGADDRPTAARRGLERARTLWESLPDQRKESAESRFELARIRYQVGLLHMDGGAKAAAIPEFEAAATLVERLVSEVRNDLQYRSLLARCRSGIAVCLAARRQRAAAQAMFEQAWSILEALQRDHPEDVDVHRDALKTLAAHLHFLHLSGDQAAGKQLAEKARAMGTRLVRDHPGDVRLRVLWACVLDASTLHAAASEPAKARTWGEQAMAEFERLEGALGDRPSLQSSLGAARSNLAAVCLREGATERARTLLDGAIAAQ